MHFPVGAVILDCMAANATKQPLDDAAKAIIGQLQIDGRRSYAEIGKAVGLSEAAVRLRVQRLVGDGVMQIVAVTDPARLGFTREAMIGLGVDGDIRAVADALTAIDEVSYAVMTAGRFDVLVELVCEDDEHLITLLHERIRTIPGVTSTETLIYLDLFKEHYRWGTR